VSSKLNYTPERGDIVWINFTPQSGREQAGHRPALVISPKVYNQKVGLALCCPITSQVKGYPFEVLLPKINKISGAVLSDHIKSLDWRARNAEFNSHVSKDILDEVISKITPLILAE
jgi:mRNA interferase MazF